MAHKITLKEKIGYGFGDAASSMFWKLFGMYIMFFYTDIFGIPAAVVGTMFLITRVGDAAFDPLVGILGDRTNTRWGKFRPYLLWMAIPFGLVGVLTFTTPELSVTGKIVYAYITYSLMMIVYSMINVPYASLMGVMTSDGKERTTLATYRFIFAFGGSFLVLGLFQPLFDKFGTNNYNEFATSAATTIDWPVDSLHTEKYIVYSNSLVTNTASNPVDSMLFFSARAITKSNDALSIGLMDKVSGKTSWFNFPAAKDTLGLKRDGTTGEVLLRLSAFSPVIAKEQLSNLQLVLKENQSSLIQLNKVTIKEINYQSGYQKAVIVIAILAIIFFLFTFAWTKEQVEPLHEKTSLKNDVKDLLKNAPWFILLGAGISTIFFNTIRDAAAIYYFKYYVQSNSAISFNALNVTIALSTLYLLLGQAANIIGVVLAKPVSDKIGKKNTFLYAMIAASVLSLIFYGLKGNNVIYIFVLQFFISISAGIIFPLVWSMYADTADFSEWKNKRRATGLVFSAASMSQKFGASIGIALAGWLLSFYGYHANVAQTAEAQQGIRMMLSVYPAVGALLAALFMVIYPLKESVLDKIGHELAEFRKGQKQ